jgi:hypothetical protein
MKTINIATQFSRTPGGRNEDDGKYSGERFRRDFLAPALKGNKKVRVLIDGTSGYGSSFLEEAFGGLVRVEGFTAPALHESLEIVTSDPGFDFYRTRIWQFIDAAKSEHGVR